MLNGRPYKKAKLKEKIIEEFEQCFETQFDPVLCKHFLEIIKQVVLDVGH